MSKHASAGVHWVIQQNQTDARNMAALITEMGHVAHLVGLVPFSPDIPEVDSVPPGVPVVCWGASFVPRAVAHPAWRPGIFFDDTKFCWSAFQSVWGDAMLNVDAKVMPLGDVFEALGETGIAFVRPDADNKAFDSGVHTATSLLDAIARSRMPDGTRAEMDLAAVVAQPREVMSEFRMFVVDGDVVAASSYRHLGTPNLNAFVPHAVIEFAMDVAAIWMPAPVACLDIGIDSTGRMGIVEVNCFNAARLYGADAATVVDAVSEYAGRTHAPADAPARHL